MKYARIADGRVAETFELPAEVELATAFHPDILSTLAPCGPEVAEGWTFDGAAFAAPAAPAATEEELIAYAAARRWSFETGGAIVAGVPVRTDRESQGLINGAYALVQADPSAAIRFKAEVGFVDLDAAQMTAVAIAVARHVQDAFAREAELVASIGEGAVTTTAAIDAAFAVTP